MRSSNKQKYIAFIILYISDPSGWWRGKKTNGEEGLFPGTYVEKMQRQENKTNQNKTKFPHIPN